MSEFKRKLADVWEAFASDDAGDDTTSAVMQSFRPVGIEKELSDDYGVLYQKRDMLTKVGAEAAKLGIELNYLLSFLRGLVSDEMINHYEQGDDAELNEYILQQAGMHYKQGQSTVNTGRDETVANFVKNVASAGRFVINPSVRYPGGADIILRGKDVNDSNTLGNVRGYSGGVAYTTTESDYEQQRLRNYTTRTALKASAAISEVYTELFGRVTNITKQYSAVIPITSKMVAIQGIVERNMGVTFPFTWVQGVDATHRSALPRFLSLELMCIPNKVSEDRNKTFVKHAIRQETSEYPMEAALKADAAYSRDITQESILFNRNFALTFRFEFESELAQYVSQSVPYNPMSLRGWFLTWVGQFFEVRGARDVNVRKIRRTNIPKYSLPLTQVKESSKVRASAGLKVENSRTNEDSLYFSPSGTLRAMPTVEQMQDNENLERFSAITEERNAILDQYGCKLSEVQDVEDAILAGISEEDYARLFELDRELQPLKGSLLAHDWDLGIAFYCDVDGAIVVEREIGAAKPNGLNIAELLGFNMSESDPNPRCFSEAMVLATHSNLRGLAEKPEHYAGSQNNPDGFSSTPEFLNLAATYAYYTDQSIIEETPLPPLQELVLKAIQELNPGVPIALSSLQPYAGPSYLSILDEQGLLRPVADMNAFTVRTLQRLWSVATIDCSGRSGSALYNDMRARGELGRSPIEDEEMYFQASSNTMADLEKTVYRTLGGLVFKYVAAAVASLPMASLLAPAPQLASGLNRPDVNKLLETVRPVAVLMGEYVPAYPEWEAKAQQEVESIRKDPSIDVSDINFAGNSEGFAVFPHQLDTQRYLRKATPPAFAVLDIRPGGGKTSIGIVDIACIVDDMSKIGKKVLPLIICPDGLIRNWCDDTTRFGGGNWNIIPINNGVVDRWGRDEIVEMVQNAPANTLCVTGIDFLKSKQMPVAYGGIHVEVSMNLELIKACGFNYIIIDESHKLKNKSSARHRFVKRLTTSTNVEYLRIATGTLIADRVTDIEGQAALYQPTIFREGELANAVSTANVKVKDGSEDVGMWTIDSPQKARERLSRYAAVITKAKKEWAFMLPSPVETFHGIEMVSAESEFVELEELHQQLYDLVVQQSVDMLQELVKTAKKSRSGDDDDDDRDESDDEGVVNLEGGKVELDSSEELGMLNPTLVEAYLQRIERLIIAPSEDPAFETVFGAAGARNFQSRKARFIAGLVEKHFNVPEWNKGSTYNEYTLVARNGATYLSRKIDTSNISFNEMPPASKGVPPEEDNVHWKLEPEGKIIIFCRYTNSVNAVYDALGKYQSMALKFTGKEKDKWGNLERFKTDPSIKILVANEVGLSEGHNLQMASRMIRVESPWGPGELDQSASRIFRPDPKGAEAGEIYREIVYLDWVCANKTMEVPKMCRLIAKVFDATRFDESDNPRYTEILEQDLEEVSLSIENTLQVRSSLKDYPTYTSCYSELNGIRLNEFAEMRATQSVYMIPLEHTPPVKGSERIDNVPFIPSQEILDEYGTEPQALATLLTRDGFEAERDDPDLLVGTPVITDHGNGMILSVKKRTMFALDAEGNRIKDGKGKDVRIHNPNSPISSMRVRIKGKEGDDIIVIPHTGLVFVPQKLTEQQKKELFEVDLVYRTVDIRRRERERERLEMLEEALIAKELEQKKAAETKELKKKAKLRKEAEESANTRKRNEKEGKPINTGVKRTPKPKLIKGVIEESEAEVRTPLKLSPAYYHGYLTLETDDMDYEKELKKLKFKTFGAYAYVEVKRRNQANAVMDYIEDNFVLSDATAERLGVVFTAFEKGKRGLYSMELAKAATLPHFFTVQRRMVKDRKEARIYPMFKDDVLTLVCDIATCPVIKKHIGRTIPGATAKWRMSTGNMMLFVKNKMEMRERVKSITKSGIEIEDSQELLKAITAIRFKTKTTKK